tara:strand:- start:1358 stop:2566 length:1209 start_codon:yes stop_codon:yes gene_type:complete
MARNRIIYQSEALFVSRTGKTASGDINQLHRVQSANYSFDLARQDINQFGHLAAVDRIITEAPTVSLDYSYYCQTGENEVAIGLDVGKYDVAATTALVDKNSCISGILKASDLTPRQDISTYYIETYGQGDDAAENASAAASVISIGNAFLSSYSVNGSVGDFVTADVSVEALNMMFESTDVGDVHDPTVNESDGTMATDVTVEGTVILPMVIRGTGDSGDNNTYAAGTNLDIPIALRHGDISMALTDNALGYDLSGDELHAQSFSFSFDLSRTNLEKLGSRFAYSKEIDFPLSTSSDISFIVGDVDQGASTNPDRVERFLNSSDPEFDLVINCFGNGQSAGTSTSSIKDGLRFSILGAKLDSQGFSSSIGDNKTMDISVSAQIGGPQDTTHGIQIDHLTEA